jgi:hypothetical protein
LKPASLLGLTEDVQTKIPKLSQLILCALLQILHFIPQILRLIEEEA